jgi:hypothetical protein
LLKGFERLFAATGGGAGGAVHEHAAEELVTGELSCLKRVKVFSRRPPLECSPACVDECAYGSNILPLKSSGGFEEEPRWRAGKKNPKGL